MKQKMLCLAGLHRYNTTIHVILSNLKLYEYTHYIKGEYNDEICTSSIQIQYIRELLMQALVFQPYTQTYTRTDCNQFFNHQNNKVAQISSHKYSDGNQ